MKSIKKVRKSFFALVLAATTVVTGVMGIQNANAEDKMDKLENNRPFRIQPVKAESMVIDAYGDKLPNWKTPMHLFSNSGSENSSEIIPYYQPENNNSFEFHMQNDRGLCVGPDVNRPQDIKDGTPMVAKRDCANTLNHVYEGQQLRVNNSNFCVDIPYANFSMLTKIQYHQCNQTNAQLLNLIVVKSNDETKAFYCYRKTNDRPCENRTIPFDFNRLEWTGGAWATLILKTEAKVEWNDTDEISVGGYKKTFSKTTGLATTYSIDLNNNSGKIKFPPDVKTYSIRPWNEHAQTSVQFLN
jgi:hypothetical protein